MASKPKAKKAAAPKKAAAKRATVTNNLPPQGSSEYKSLVLQGKIKE